MTEPQKTVGWWQTLPGVLAAVAAVVTALSGLVAVLFQSGFLGGKAEPPSRPQTPLKVDTPILGGAAQNAPASAVHSTQPAKTPGSDAAAVVLSRDGTTTRLRANSLSNCISVGHEIELDAGQSIPFEKISSLEVLHADDHTTPNAKAGLKIALRDGTTVSGTVDAVCDLFGYNDMGRFSTYYDRLRSIHFEE